jgi:hypothetical protein
MRPAGAHSAVQSVQNLLDTCAAINVFEKEWPIGDIGLNFPLG